jgi:hypothetical protein
MKQFTLAMSLAAAALFAFHEPKNRFVDSQPLAIFRFMAGEQVKKEPETLGELVSNKYSRLDWIRRF